MASLARRLSIPIKSTLSIDSPARIAQAVHKKMQSIVQKPINVSDFRGMGHRTAACASFTEAVVADSDLDRSPILLPLGNQMPWLQRGESPFSSPSSTPAGTLRGRKLVLLSISAPKTSSSWGPSHSHASSRHEIDSPNRDRLYRQQPSANR